MKKKVFSFLLIGVLGLTGCGNNSKNADIVCHKNNEGEEITSYIYLVDGKYAYGDFVTKYNDSEEARSECERIKRVNAGTADVSCDGNTVSIKNYKDIMLSGSSKDEIIEILESVAYECN